MNDLKLRLKATFVGLVGYGEVYACEVVEVLQGDFNKDLASITVMGMDTAHSKTLSDNQNPTVLDISFKKKEENVPYEIMPITGLVDGNKTSWAIETITIQE